MPQAFDPISPEIVEQVDYVKYFNACVGTINDTHILASLPCD